MRAMSGGFKDMLRALRYSSPASLWTQLRFWWSTSAHRGAVLLLTAISVALGSAAALIAHAVEQTHIERQLSCLALNIYHEARGEPIKGQYAVAEVTLNRVASSRFPDSVCAVVFEKRWDAIRKRDVGAFSWTELDKSGELSRQPWSRARAVATQVYYRRHPPLVEGALFYHAEHIRPSWADNKQKLASIGRHIFYR